MLFRSPADSAIAADLAQEVLDRQSAVSAEASARIAEDLTLFKKDGSRAMTGAMNMASYALSNVGDVSFVGGMKVKIELVNSNYSILSSDYYIGVTDLSSSRTVTLPSAAVVGAGKVYVVKDHSGDANQSHYVIVAASGSEKVDGGSSFELKAAYESVILVSDGSDWFVM